MIKGLLLALTEGSRGRLHCAYELAVLCHGVGLFVTEGKG